MQMNHILNKVLSAAGLLFLSFSGISGAESRIEGDAQERALIEQRNAVSMRREKAVLEQERLLFLQQMYAADSKYLLIDIPGGKGTLNYRDRILRSFDFVVVADGKTRIGSGVKRITAKSGNRDSIRYLVIDEQIAVLKKSDDKKGNGVRRKNAILLRSSDFASLFYAVEKETRIYVYGI